MKELLIGLLVASIFTISCGKETTYVCLEPNPPVAECCADDPTLTYCQTPLEDMAEDMEMPVCAPACSGTTPFCDVSGECVACRGASDCPDGDCVGGACVGCTDSAQCSEGVCDTELGACVACLDATDCPGDAVCYLEDSNADNRCVECLSNAECGDIEASRCGPSNTCVPCSQGSDCTHLDLAQCVKDECVECTTATEASDCGGNVCDPSTNTCTDRAIGSTLALNTCVSDTQCQANHACVPLNYNGNPHGNYCMRIFSGTPCPRPYGDGGVERVSVNEQSVTVCMILDLTTPEALADYGNACTTANAATDCPAPGARCEIRRPSSPDMSQICTYICAGNSDCWDGSTCLTTNPRYCGAEG